MVRVEESESAEGTLLIDVACKVTFDASRGGDVLLGVNHRPLAANSVFNR